MAEDEDEDEEGEREGEEREEGFELSVNQNDKKQIISWQNYK